MSLPLAERMMSPGCSPPLAAGPPGSTLLTSAPRGRSRPKLSARSEETWPMATPILPRATRPSATSCFWMSLARSMGMAKEMPM